MLVSMLYVAMVDIAANIKLPTESAACYKLLIYQY